MGQSGSCGDHTVHQVQCAESPGEVGGGRLLPAVLDEPGEGGDLGLGAVVVQSLGGETVVVRVGRGEEEGLGRGAVVASSLGGKTVVAGGDRGVGDYLLQYLSRGEGGNTSRPGEG